VYIVTRSRSGQTESNPGRRTGHPTRSQNLRYRLRYAEKGIRTSPADVGKKKPHLKGWQDKATTDPQQIIAESNAWPAAGILTPTGEQDGRWVLDVDSLQDLARLEEALGVRVRGISTEVRTQRDHLQIHFSWPEGADIRNSVGKNVGDGFEGLDVRGQGGLALLPPSDGYSFANDLRMVGAPPVLVEWARSRKKSAAAGPEPTQGRAGSRWDQNLSDEGLVLKGSRHRALIGFLGRMHDGTRGMQDLIALGHKFNSEKCSPPIGSPGDDDNASDIEKGARWVHSKPRCNPSREADPELEELLQAASDLWYAEQLRGGGRSKQRDVARACLLSASLHYEMLTVEVEGEERRVATFSDSLRQLAEVANTSHMSVKRALKDLVAVGLLSLLTVVTLRQEAVAGADATSLVTAGQSLVALHGWTFILGPGFVVGVGNGLMLGYLMYRSGLVPRRLAVLGLIAGPLIIASGAAVVLGVIEAGGMWQTIAAIPEFLWELSLGIWLIVRGFNPSVIASEKFRPRPA
jgi:hypothetical protein